MIRRTIPRGALVLAAALALAATLGASAAPTLAQPRPPAAVPTLGGLGVPLNPKVLLRFDAFHDVDQLGAALEAIAAAHPNLARKSSIGRSYEGRNIDILTVTNFRTGDDRSKPAMWIDANIHGNEIQGSEVALYTAWYLTEMHGQVPAITELLDRVAFYIVPTINPDGRQHFFDDPQNMHSSRGGRKPVDNDNDGLLDEDNPDDMDGDGHIVQMRVADPRGRWKVDPNEPRRMIRAKADEPGTHSLLGSEGFDNDGDGRVNEDPVGGYDPNRNWPSAWQPDFVQGGAIDYPGSLPETKAVLDFVIDHPNIAAAQTYHNAGGMILRGPGQESIRFPSDDIAVYDQIGETGAKILPGYRYFVLWKDLYPVWGGEIDWFYLGRGAITFSNELWTSYNFFRDPEELNGNFTGDSSDEFNKLLLLGEGFVDWKPIDHPTYGRIEIGGEKKNFGRVPPGFLLAEECHRNMAFTLYHATQMPKPVIDEPRVTPLAGGLRKVRVTVANERVIPTRTAHDVNKKITPPDVAQLSGGAIAVLSAGIADGPLSAVVSPEPAHRPAGEVRVDTLPGMGRVTLEWIVRGSGTAEVRYRSQKGGTVTRTVTIP
jgi:hypothetical protein